MFRRNTSRLEHRGALRRSKSTGSVSTNHFRNLASIEPHAAHRDAHIAARISFTKAREESEKSNSMGIPASSSTYGLTRSDSFMKGPDVLSYDGDKSEATIATADTSLCRQRSVRFTGPTARKKRELATRANGSWAEFSDSSGPMRSSAFAGHLPRSSPLVGHAYDDYWFDRSVDLESKHDGTCESETSFYPIQRQKLRKSRSMLTGSFMSSECHSESTATAMSWNPDGPAKHAVLGTGKSSLRSPKSMSFLRLNANKGPTIRRQQDTSISRSPSRLSLRGSVRLKSRSSMFFRGKNKRNASLTEIKKSMRNSSNNSMPMPSTISSTASSLSKGSGLRKAARKVSKSMKSKFRGIFGLPKKQEEIEAMNTTDTSSVHRSKLSLQEETSMSRVKSYVPSLRSVASEHCLQAHQGSVEVIEDGTQQTDGERSRVTSWTNSSTYTVVSSTIDAEWEPQRLSVIDEGGYTGSTLERWRSSEDEERAYSALVQRLDDMQKQQHRESNFRNGSSTEVSDVGVGNVGATSTSGVTPSQSESNFGGVSACDTDTETARFSGGASTGVSSPTGHLFRTQSPFRRALRQSMRIQERSSSIKPVNLRYLSSLSALSLPTRKSSPNGSEHDIHLSSAESVYSNLSNSPAKASAPESPFELDDFDTITLSSPQGGGQTPTAYAMEKTHQREVSTASSVEWKTWLSAKVSKLEDCGQASKVLSQEQTWNPWSTMGHVRENAEIEPNSNSDASDADECKDNSVGPLEHPALPVTQSIVIEDDVERNNYPRLTHDENAPPEYHKGAESEKNPKAVIRSVSSLPNVKPSEVYEAARRNSITPKKQTASPCALTESPSRARKSYFNSGAASSLKSSHGLTAAVRRQFGTVATGSPRRRSIRGGEDVTQVKTVREAASFDDCQFRRGLDAQAMGSKRMVELFLNSRKNKRTEGTSEWSGAFV
ncbi:hypothetical protein NLG97_g9047 [Lecanicillium saksenae]|uniref:Uncharacterized protein n=1 Tax=Lecanicillium saksenae TaxID=468837 RepID=A0ACC1QJU0_9HYPO|nr:hypothetical protein NLG97_g9047 [Lecanicillium saksenae]